LKITNAILYYVTRFWTANTRHQLYIFATLHTSVDEYAPLNILFTYE